MTVLINIYLIIGLFRVITFFATIVIVGREYSYFKYMQMGLATLFAWPLFPKKHFFTKEELQKAIQFVESKKED